MTSRQQQQMMAQSLVEMGNIESDQGNLEPALSYLNEALELFRGADCSEGQGRVLNNIGLILAHKGEYICALELYVQGLEHYRNEDDAKGEAKILSNMAYAHKMNGNYVVAKELAQTAISLHQSHGARRFEGIVQGNLGNIFMELGEPTKARHCYQQSIAILEEIGAKRVLSIAILNLAGSSLLLDQPHRALAELERSHELQKGIGDQRVEAILLGVRGRCHLEFDERELAEEKLQMAFIKCHELGIPETGVWAAILAELRSRSTTDASSLCALLQEGHGYVATVPEEHARFQARAAVVYCRLSMLEDARHAMSVAQAIREQLHAGPRSELVQLITEAQRKISDF